MKKETKKDNREKQGIPGAVFQLGFCTTVGEGQKSSALFSYLLLS
jgi:hypothetical protein